jgi:radical SAM-linked protein
MYKVKFIFTKKGPMKYISHLDLMRLFMRALRRADLPIKLTEGFSPHPKLSIKRALKLGIESDNEEASIVLKEQVSPEEFKERLQKQFPQGIEIRNVEGNFNQC